MYSIVIADSEPLIRKELRMMVEKLDLPYQVAAEAENGLSAMEKIRECEPDVVFTDVQPAGAGALTLPERIRQTYPQIKLIVLSGYDDVSYAEKASRFANSSYLVKPVEREELRAMLERLREELDTERELKPDAIERARQFIRQHYAENLKMEVVAEQLYMNPAYFSSLFKKETRQTFTEFLTNLRMNEAKRLLIEEGGRIEDIAYRVGYSDQKAFCKAFKRTTGYSPAQFKAERA